jgi:CRP-like cAMP-binding protein
LIDEGVVKLVHFEEDGRELTVGVRLTGWILGSASVILGKASPVAAFTITACCLQRLDASTFLEMLSSNSTLSLWLHKMHSQEVFDQLVSLTRRVRCRLGSASNTFSYNSFWHREITVMASTFASCCRFRIATSPVSLGLRPSSSVGCCGSWLMRGVIRRKKGWIIVTDLHKLGEVQPALSGFPVQN